MVTRPECVEVLFGELESSAGQDPRLGRHVERLRNDLADLDTIAYRARKVAEDICLALQGALLVRHGRPAVAEAFLTTRIDGRWGGAFGTMPPGLDVAPILERALVKG
jgi:putative acyl-CoA dehydrogenase